MKNLLTEKEINQFQKNGAIFIKGKFDLNWIEKLKIGIEKDINECSYGDLKNLMMKGGDKIPTLEEALDCIGGQTKVNIELKGKEQGF